MENKELEKELENSIESIEVRDFSSVWDDIKDKVKPEKKRLARGWMPAVLAASLVIVVGVVIFSINTINEQPSDEPLLGFAETEIYTTQATAIESNLFMNAMGFDFNLQYSTYQAVRTIENDDLVFMIIYGEIETETDYYLLTFKFHINERYHFIEKAEYESLKNEMTVGDYTIWYEFNETLSDELKTYNMKIARNESVCYLEMQCFENDFDGFIALLAQ